MKHEINTDAAAAGAEADASAAAPIWTTVFTVVSQDAAAETGAPPTASSALIACFILISSFQFSIFYVYVITLILHIDFEKMKQ